MKLIVGLLPVGLMSNVQAKWEVWEGTAESSIFFDSSSIQHEGNIATAWVVYNHSATQEVGIDTYRSAMIQYALDCPNKRTAVFKQLLFEDIWAKGKLVATLEPKQGWQKVQGNSFSEKLFNRLCSEADKPK